MSIMCALFRRIPQLTGLALASLLALGCGPPPKTESMLAYEQFIRAVYSNDMSSVIAQITPESQKRLRKQLNAVGADDESLASRMGVALGWEFERMSGRLTKLVRNRSDASRQVLSTDIGGRPWHIVMKNTAGGWKVALFESKQVGL